MQTIKFVQNGKAYIQIRLGQEVDCEGCVFEDDDEGCEAAPTACIDGGVYKEAKE